MARKAYAARLLLGLIVSIAAALAQPAQPRAQNLGDKPIRMLVAIAAGDLARWTRIIADAGIKQE